MKQTERELRIDLAAAFRLAAKFDWHESVANHFSVAVGDEGMFLLNPKWRHFTRIKASDLALLDASGDVGTLPGDLDPTAWFIHGTMHARLPQARCLIHLHPPYATALSCLADPTIPPIDQTTARFYNRIAVDQDYTGMADNKAEGERLSAAMGNHQVMIMGNHGVIVAGQDVADAFDTVYHLERACRTLMLAYGAGRPLKPLPHEAAERTARDWELLGEAWSRAHFEEMKLVLDREDPSYAA